VALKVQVTRSVLEDLLALDLLGYLLFQTLQGLLSTLDFLQVQHLQEIQMDLAVQESLGVPDHLLDLVNLEFQVFQSHLWHLLVQKGQQGLADQYLLLDPKFQQNLVNLPVLVVQHLLLIPKVLEVQGYLGFLVLQKVHEVQHHQQFRLLLVIQQDQAGQEGLEVLPVLDHLDLRLHQVCLEHQHLLVVRYHLWVRNPLVHQLVPVYQGIQKVQLVLAVLVNLVIQ